ncbi:MAG: glycoside hydrolase family 2 TIM barrel-domain containing protein, partial [Rikenellaceae bacterium]
MKKQILLLMILLSGCYTLSAQDLTTLWTGLTQPQSEMPQGNAPAQKAERVAPKDIKTRLVAQGENQWILSDGWRMMDNATIIDGGEAPLNPKLDVSEWYNATVPGTVLTTLVDQGVYPDPYFGLNNMAIPESLARSQWWYRIEFDAPESTAKNSFLLFNGINYSATVYLNGKRVGEMKGAFKRGEFNVTELLKAKGNILTVHICPPTNPGIPHEQTMKLGQGLNGGMLSNDGPTFISSIGWDWVPGIRDRNTGIWQDVRLRQSGDVVIGDPLVATNLPLPDTTTADISIKVPIKNISGKTITGVVKADIEGLQFESPYTLKANQECEITLKEKLNAPRLWWPNGYGNPDLYTVELSVTNQNELSDKKDVRFGVRELSYELMVNQPKKGNVRYAYTPVDRNDTKEPLFDYINRVKYSKLNELPTLQSEDLSGLVELDQNDPVGAFLAIRVNGVRIFCRGGNWGMNDAMKRVSRETQEPYFELHKLANFNMVRNWTGESTDQTFYELCDEYGMLIWNDFWITTDDTVEPYDQQLFVDNARDVVRRFRNHPSIAIWNPRNEGFAPEGLDVSLPEMMAQEDNTRHYHGQSRFLNMDGSGPWGYFKDPSLY